MRCFIALSLPFEARAALAAWVEAYRGDKRNLSWAPALSWARPEGYHLTLAFLGEIEGAGVDTAAAALDAAAGFGAIPFSFKDIGGFPEKGPWRVLYAGIEDGGSCASIYRLINEALAAGSREAGLPPLNPEWPSGRPFAPHITLARARAGRGIPAGHGAGRPEAELAAKPDGAWTIGHCALYKSELRRGGAVYTEVRGVDLSGK
jgi:RNA 2',3'-cyclic 3'-phosphodiesterase